MKTKGKKKEPLIVKITKQESNKIKKLIPNVLRGIEAVLSEPEEESEAEESDEQIKEMASPTPPKRILRIKGVKTVSTKADA